MPRRARPRIRQFRRLQPVHLGRSPVAGVGRVDPQRAHFVRPVRAGPQTVKLRLRRVARVRLQHHPRLARPVCKVPRLASEHPSPVPVHAVIRRKPPVRRSQKADRAVRIRRDHRMDPAHQRAHGLPVDAVPAMHRGNAPGWLGAHQHLVPPVRPRVLAVLQQGGTGLLRVEHDIGPPPVLAERVQLRLAPGQPVVALRIGQPRGERRHAHLVPGAEPPVRRLQHAAVKLHVPVLPRQVRRHQRRPRVLHRRLHLPRESVQQLQLAIVKEHQLLHPRHSSAIGPSQVFGPSPSVTAAPESLDDCRHSAGDLTRCLQPPTRPDSPAAAPRTGDIPASHPAPSETPSTHWPAAPSPESASADPPALRPAPRPATPPGAPSSHH